MSNEKKNKAHFSASYFAQMANKLVSLNSKRNAVVDPDS